MQKINSKYVVVGLGVVGFVFFATSLYVQSQQAEYSSMIKLLIANQETTLISLAEVTDRNGADAIVEDIIKDCNQEDRQRFDTLLGELGNLPYKEIVEVDQLFSACGNFYSERKALMTARLNREFAIYSDYVDLIDVVDSRSKKIDYPVDKWSELVTLELQRSVLLTELVEIQQNIITALLDRVSINSDQVQQEVNDAQEVKDTLSYTGVRIDTLREDIIGL